MGIKKRNILLTLLAGAGVIALVLALVFNYILAYAAGDRHDVVRTVKAISPGVTETEYITNTEDNDDQNVLHAVEVDLSRNDLVASYKDYNTNGTWGLQSVREQAAAYEQQTGRNVVAGFNADFFNMATGEPSGALVMGGKVVHESKGRSYFAILKDGTPVIRTGALQGDEQEAVGGSIIMLDNEVVMGDPGSYYTGKEPRTVIGIKANGTVVLAVADGRQSPYSSGYASTELSEKLLELGCVDALHLDGGGSATYVAQYAGTDELVVGNSPSDGQERSVSSALLVVSNSEATGKFASAIISPNNEVYTPGSTVDFSAIGADTAGFAMAIPEGATWQVAEGSAVKGEITEAIGAEGELAATFVAEDGAVGTATVEVVYEGTVYGSTQIELQWPDTLTMTNSRFSLNFGEETDFGLTAYWQMRVVHLKEGDLVWEIGETGNEEFPSIGKMNGDIFVADDKATNVTATVTAKLAHDESIMASAEVSVGVLPYVVWDFEDITDPETGEVTMTAEEYYFGGDTPRFAVTTSKGGIGASGKIVDATTGEVRVGQKALQINYDFTQSSATAGVYFGTTQPMRIPSLGMPTAWGVWIYVPVDDFTFWLRTWFEGYDAEGNKLTGNSFAGGFGGNFTKGDGSVELHQGWNYIYADFTAANSFGASYYEFSTMAFRIMWASSAGSATSGYIYLDNFQFEYGANTDDKYAPEIQSVNLDNSAGETVAEDGSTVVSNDPFSL